MTQAVEVLSAAMLRVLKARDEVARRDVFFASILYTARLIETDYAPQALKTLFTNGIDVYFHPDFVKENDAHIEGALLHETLHCAFNHTGRRQNSEVMIWNMACDFAINPLVTSVYTLPGCALIDREFDGLSAERIYDQLKDEFGDLSGKIPSEESGHMFEPTPEELEQAQREWRRIVKLAAELAEMAGTLHGTLGRLVEEIFPGEKLGRPVH